jgi:ElaB/YqjD/DUF883 family membrane-anchored ribosome-binding protein
MRSGAQRRPEVTDEQRSPEEIREDIAQTREELGDTAAALADKTDVKKQAKTKMSGVQEKASATAESVKQTAAAKREEMAEKTPESAGAAAQRVQTFVRDHPAPIAIGGAFAAGFALGRRRSR